MVNTNSVINQVAYLKKILNVDFLNNLDLMKEVSFVNLSQGQIFFNQGDEAKSCFLVVSGSLKVVMKNKNVNSTVTIISKGEMGGTHLMDRSVTYYPVSMIALTDVSLVNIPKETFLNYWMKNLEAVNFVNASMRCKVKHLQEDKLYQILAVETRVINFLHRHYLEKKDLVTFKITRKEIAAAVGAKTETIIRVLKSLERAGVIKTENSIITILDKNYILKSIENDN